MNVWYVCLKCWVGWHCKCKQMAQGASAGLQDLDVHRFCMWSCHASFLCLPVGPLLWITSYHIFSISTLKPRWEAPLNLLLVGTAFAFHVFWLFELTRPGQKNRAAVQEWRCGEHFNDSIPKTIQGAFQVDFIHHVYTYIYIYVCFFFFVCVCIISFCLIAVFFSSLLFRRSDSYWQLFSPFPTVLALLPYSLWWSSRYHKSMAFFGRCPRPFSEASAMQAQSLAMNWKVWEFLASCWLGFKHC